MHGIFSKSGCFGVIILMAVLTCLTGCVPKELDLDKGERYAASGDWDRSVAYFEEMIPENPDDTRLRLLLARARFEASMAHMEKGEHYLAAGRYDEATAEFRRSLNYDPDNRKAGELMGKTADVRASHHYLEMGLKLMRAHRYYQSRDALKKAVAHDPENSKAVEALNSFRKKGRKGLFRGLKLSSSAPVSLKFKKTPIVNVFEILSKLTGVNFIFDKDMKESKVTLFMTDVAFDKFLQVLLKTNDLAAKVVNEKTLLVYPDTPAKAKSYHDLQIRTFYLANLKAKAAAALLAKALKIKNITANDKLNTVVIRGRRDLMEIAAKVIEANDRPPAEVLLNVEILEVNRSRTENLGLETSEAVSLGIGETSTSVSNSTSGFAGYASLYSLDRVTNKELFLSLPTATLNILKKDGDTRTLAQPQIRVKHMEKASIHIGERVPLRSNRKVDSNNNVTYDFEYQDVGVKLLTEPLINFNDEVELKLHLEVSALGTDRGVEGDPQYGILTRTTETVLTVRDGESIVIGGLIKNEERNDVKRVPLFGDVPVLGHLFSSRDGQSDKSDLFMTITPVIVRGQEIPGEDIALMWSGSEKSFSMEEPFESIAERKDAFREYPDEEFLMETMENAPRKEPDASEGSGTEGSRKSGDMGRKGGASESKADDNEPESPGPEKSNVEPSSGKTDKSRQESADAGGLTAGTDVKSSENNGKRLISDPMKPAGPISPANRSGSVTDDNHVGGKFFWPENVAYSIQVNSYPTREEAQKRAEELLAQNYECYLVEAEIPGKGRWYRVYVGAFDGYGPARKTCEAFKAGKAFTDDIHVADRKWAFAK